MRILALLSDNAHHLLEASLIRAQCLTKAGDAASVATWLREGRFDAFVFDPGLPESKGFNTVIGAVKESGVPTLLYATLGPVAARRIVNAVNLAPRELMLRGLDDAPEVIQRKLATLVAPSAPALLLSRVAWRFRRFPDGLQAASVSLFCRSTLPRWVTGLVCESGLARRTVDRWMDIGGISGAAAARHRAPRPRVASAGRARRTRARGGRAMRLFAASTPHRPHAPNYRRRAARAPRPLHARDVRSPPRRGADRLTTGAIRSEGHDYHTLIGKKAVVREPASDSCRLTSFC